jgi:ABC-type molybdate transport system substrate-binding protein
MPSRDRYGVRSFAGALVVASMAVGANAQEPVRVYAAGSLRDAMLELGSAFERSAGIKVVGEFGPSGLLRDRIAKGERAEVFASANMEHPQSLAGEGRAAPVVLFARNRLCALASPRAGASTAGLLDRMLDPAIKLGISTPKADPSGDYAWALFERAEKIRPGAFAALSGKALQLTGGAGSPAPPKDRNQYGVLVADGSADVFLTYCTNALAARKEIPALEVVQLPEPLAVGADYGLTVIQGAGVGAGRFALFVLSVDGQRILGRHGFATPTLP